jgi:type II secretory pathway component PulF
MAAPSLNERFIRFQFRTGGAARRRLWMKLERLVDNGVPLLDALTSIRDRRVRAGQGKSTLVQALDSWILELNKGKGLHTAVDGWVSDQEMLLLNAGSKSGDIAGTLRMIIRNMESAGKVKSAVIKGSAYPSFLLVFAFGAMYLFGFLIVPAFTSAVEGAQWTGLAAALIGFSAFVREWIVVIVAILVAIIMLFFISLPRWTRTLESVRVKLEQFPPYSLYRTIHGSSWLISLSSMMEAGMRLEDALLALKANSTPWMADRIDGALRGIRSGKNLGDALTASGYKFPDQDIIDDLAIYSSLSGFAEALKILGDEWMEGSVVRVNTIMSMVFVIGLVCVGGLIGFMVAGMFAMQVQLQSILRVAG